MSNWAGGRSLADADDIARAAMVNPEAVPLGEWHHHHLKVRATCRCGRVSFLHTGNLIQKFGYQRSLDARQLVELSEKCICIRCKSKEPKLELVVTRD